MLVKYGSEIRVHCQEDTPMVCYLSLPGSREGEPGASERFKTEPDVPVRLHRDRFGNLVHRFTAPAGTISIVTDGLTEIDAAPDPVLPEMGEIPVDELPDECLEFLLGSRYCDTDKLSQTAWDLFGEVAPGWTRVQAICDFVHNHIRFDYMAARATRSAQEAFEEQTGVCRDFAHLAITLCRCMNIPARYVNGYLGTFGLEKPSEDPPDYSAWMEVYLGGEWLTFDARHNTPRIGRIVVARGRDAVDVPLIYSFGPHLLEHFEVWTHEAEETGTAAAR